MCSQRNSTLRKHLVKSQEHSRHSHNHEHPNFRSFLFKSIANHVLYTVNTNNDANTFRSFSALYLPNCSSNIFQRKRCDFQNACVFISSKNMLVWHL